MNEEENKNPSTSEIETENETEIEVIPENNDGKNDSVNTEEIKNKAFSGVMWKFGERILAQGITFIVSMILARILSPEDYGAVAIITIFIIIADVFISSGFVIGLIRKKEVNDLQLSSVFYTNLFISILLYVIIFFMSPLVAKIYDDTSLIWLLRIIALKLPISAYNSVQSAIVSRNMEFKKFFFATLIGTIISAVVGIYMAYKGCGAWALIAQQLTNLAIDTICLMFVIKWRPKLIYSWKSIKDMLPFSSKNMATDLAGTIFNQMNAFVIGIKYTSADLAYYTKGQQLPNTVNSVVTQAVTSVMFPAIAKVSDNTETVKKAERKALTMLSYILLPLMVGMAMVAREFVIIFFTAKWENMIIFMQLMSIIAMIDILGAFDVLTLKAIGKSNVALWLELIKKPIFLGVILISMQFSVIAITIASLCYTVFALLINTAAIHKYTKYNIIEKLIDCAWPILYSGLMALSIFSISFIPISNIYIVFALKVIVGMVVYLSLSIITKNKTFIEIKDRLLRKMKKINNCDNIIKNVRIKIENLLQ